MDKKFIGYILIAAFIVFLISLFSFFDESEKIATDSSIDQDIPEKNDVDDSLGTLLKVKDSVIAALRIQLAYAKNTAKVLDTAKNQEGTTKTLSQGIQIRITDLSSYDDQTNVTLEFFSLNEVNISINHKETYINLEGNTITAKKSSESNYTVSRFTIPANTRKKITLHYPAGEKVDFIEYFFCNVVFSPSSQYAYEARNLTL